MPQDKRKTTTTLPSDSTRNRPATGAEIFTNRLPVNTERTQRGTRNLWPNAPTFRSVKERIFGSPTTAPADTSATKKHKPNQ